MNIDRVANYFRSYDKERFQVIAQQGAEPDAAAVSAFEQTIGFPLPKDFREFSLHPLGGLYMEAREEIWPPAKEFDVGPFWSFLRGLMVYGFSAEAPEWLTVAHAWKAMCEGGSPELVPFLKIIGDADPYCFTSTGKIVIWRHEEPEEPEHVDGSF